MASKKSKSNKKSKLKQHKTVIAAPKKVYDKKYLMGGAVTLMLTFFCFSSGLNHGFVNWDDDRNIFKNEHITSLNAENFWSNTADIFSSTVIGNYNPLTIWTFAVEKMVYGIDNLGKWHLTNIFLHLICVLLVLRISKLMGLGWRGAVFVALLFGVHPMRVESVAWLTERKDVLYGAFYLAALWLFIKGRQEKKHYLVLIIVLFGLSLLSKIQAVVLPVSMILVDYYFDGKFEMKSILRKVPLLLMSLGFGILGIYFLSGEGSIGSNSNTYESWQRIFIGSYSYVIYLVKAVIPYQLSPLYPYPASIPWYFYPSLLIAPVLIYGLYYFYKKDRRVLFFGLSFFTVNIFFLLQILGAGQGFLADRFTYIAYFGLFFMAGYGFEYLLGKYKSKNLLLSGVSAVIITVFALMSYQQTQIWENSGTLWSHVLKYYKNSTLPWGNRANYLRDTGKTREALRGYSESIRLNPEGAQAYNSRARLYFDLAKSQDTLVLALNDYNKAIELLPNDGEFYVNRGATYARLGNAQQAIKDMSDGIRLDPSHAVGYLNRSVMYDQTGQHSLALMDIESYLKLRPYNADLWYEKGRVLRQLGRAQNSLPAYDRALELNANKSLFYYERSRTKAELKDKVGATSDLRNAISLGHKNIDPSYRQSLGL